jgi:hypothetical protein
VGGEKSHFAVCKHFGQGEPEGSPGARFEEHCSRRAGNASTGTRDNSPFSSRHGTQHTHAHPSSDRKSTHRISRSRSARKAPSSMQLMWLLSSCLWKARESVKAERGRH